MDNFHTETDYSPGLGQFQGAETEEQETWHEKIISSSLVHTYGKKTGKACKFEH